MLTVLLSCYCVAIALILMLRIEYSRSSLLIGFILSFIWIASQRYFITRRMKVNLHSFSNIKIEEFGAQSYFTLTPCTSTTKVISIEHGVVCNFHEPLSKVDEEVLANCSLNDIPIYHSELLKERLNKKVQLDNIEPNNLKLFSSSRIYQRIKRSVDIMLILLFSPILVVISSAVAIAVKLNNSRESILFKQERCGVHGLTFQMYKFRSMHSTEESSADFATNLDHRIDNLGAFLRKTRLDELPQFWNVLKGDMAIIGPRPEQPYFAQQFQAQIPLYGYRHSVKPGITGWAQVEQGYTDSTDSTKEKVAFDLYYIKNLSAQLDLYILLKTAKIVLMRKGV
ncbi:sugar transferase [Vibrio breoganii]